MNLDDLLKEPGSSPAWRDQRRKLLGFAIAAAVGVAAVAAGIFTFQRFHHAREPAADPQLVQLMKMRQQTEQLQQEIEQLRAAKSSGAPRSSGRTPVSAGPPSGSFQGDPGQGFTSVAPVRRGNYIPTGAVFLAQLITPIKTSVQKTFVMAETTHEFRMDQKRLIPAHSRLIGRSRLDPILKGVIVEFDLLVLPNGIETSLSGLALSRNALPEIEGLYFSDRLQNYSTALAFGFLSGFADAARERQTTIFGSQPDITLGNQVLGGLSTASFQVADEILRDIRERAIEYVVVPAGERVFVALTRRYEMNQEEPPK